MDKVNWKRKIRYIVLLVLAEYVVGLALIVVGTVVYFIYERSASSTSTHEPPPPTYPDLSVGNAPLWFKQDVNAITKAMNTWGYPSKAGMVWGGCSADSDLALVVGNFLADLKTREMPSPLRAIQQELLEGAMEMETGAHLGDGVCKAAEQQDSQLKERTALDLYRGFNMVYKGYTRLEQACSTLDHHGNANDSGS